MFLSVDAKPLFLRTHLREINLIVTMMIDLQREREVTCNTCTTSVRLLFLAGRAEDERTVKQPDREQYAIRLPYRNGCVIIKFYDGLLMHSPPDQTGRHGGLDCRPHMYNSRNRGRIQDARGAQYNHRTVTGAWNMQILSLVKSDG